MIDGYQWERDTIGQAGAGVYKLHGKKFSPDLFLKHGKGDVAGEIADEWARLGWLADRIAVPKILKFCRTDDEAWLLMHALPGATAHQMLNEHPKAGPVVVDALASFLKDLHAIPVGECPFASDHTLRLGQARLRIESGVVDVDDFDDERQGWNAEQVWEALHQQLPFEIDTVVAHGDFSLDNILIENDIVVGCIDVGRAGVADRYQDLAILWNALAEFGPELQDRLFNQYGIRRPDERKL
jgi:aminoglycoside 3'-phosphotransferase-1